MITSAKQPEYQRVSCVELTLLSTLNVSFTSLFKKIIASSAFFFGL